MSGMLQNMVENTIDNYIETKYAHLKFPSVVMAKVSTIVNSGQCRKVTIQVLDSSKNPDEHFPEIPDVVTEIDVLQGDILVVALAYGEYPYIIGRWRE